jgi:hypothetical protein
VSETTFAALTKLKEANELLEFSHTHSPLLEQIEAVRKPLWDVLDLVFVASHVIGDVNLPDQSEEAAEDRPTSAHPEGALLRVAADMAAGDGPWKRRRQGGAAPAANPPMSRHNGGIPLPQPHHEVTLHVEIGLLADENEVTVEYVGAPAAIVAAGVCAAELVGRWKAGCTRRDQDGDRALLDRERTWVRLRLHGKSVENALKLPGVTLVRIEAAREYWRRACADHAASMWVQAQDPICRDAGQTPNVLREGPACGARAAAAPRASRPNSHLRLVVDNTRGAPGVKSESAHDI